MHVLIWLRNNWKSFLELLAVGVVAAIVVFGAGHWWKYRSSAASEELYKISLGKKTPQEEIGAFLNVVDRYPRTAAGKHAMMRLGTLYSKEGKYDLAVKQFEKLSGMSRNMPMMRIAALHNLAEVHMAMGEKEKACEDYMMAASDPKNLLQMTSRLRAAACFEDNEKYDRAENLYKQITTESAEEDSEARLISEERLLWLAAKGKIRD